MRSLLRLIVAMSRVERIALGVLTITLGVSFLLLLRLYYYRNSELVPVTGGTYIEGAIGELLPLNPWFVIGNDINRDIVSLIFSGLMKYDPRAHDVVNDLADVSISSDNRVYTATIKDGLFWHDSTEEDPHPVTVDDVLYTYTTIQDPQFPNPILQQNFRGVDIKKIDDKTVRFTLSKPYAFFTSNLTLGIVPQSSFDGVSIDKLDQTLDFGFHPIGSGPYSFQSLLQTDLSTEITLKRFERPAMATYKIDRLVFRIFGDYNSLLTDIINMNGVRQVPRNQEGQPILPRRFTPVPYTLPQYVGVFFNMDNPIPKDFNVRLGLQLAVNKQEIIDTIHETKVIDTPLLEIDLGDWRYKFDATAAQGAFFDSSWNMPEKVRLQRLLEQRETNRIGPLSSTPLVALLSTGASLTLTGATSNMAFPVSINGIRVQTGADLPLSMQTLTGAWSVKMPAGNGMSGSLKLGMNILKMTNAKDDIVDSAYIERMTDPEQYRKATLEQQLVTQFIRSKQLNESDPSRITVQDMYLDGKYLRKKTADDKPHTRINDQGNPLKIRLLTSSNPEVYGKIASLLKTQWEAVGADVTLDIPASKKEFEDKLTKREYDVVLFGQSLFDNLDSYPYWHSSQIQEQTDPSKRRIDAFNLSQYASFEADTLLARIRETSVPDSRRKALAELNELWKKDIPAVILYEPISIYAHDSAIEGIAIDKLSLHADRFSHLDEWFASTKRQMVEGTTWFGFFPWLLKLGNQ